LFYSNARYKIIYQQIYSLGKRKRLYYTPTSIRRDYHSISVLRTRKGPHVKLFSCVIYGPQLHYSLASILD